MAPANSTRATTASSHSKTKSLRRGQEEKCLADSKFQQQRPAASFHGRGTEHCGHIRRPKSQPDLLEGRRRGASSAEGGRGRGRAVDGSIYSEALRRVPAKVLVNVTVLRSPGPVQVMASMEWSVADLVAAAMQLYVKEGRQPPPPTTAPSAFSLHYSQFSLERLDPKEKLIELGSRNFFLCPSSAPAASSDAAAGAFSSASSSFSSSLSSSSPSSSSSSSSCSREASEKASKIGMTWLKFIDFSL